MQAMLRFAAMIAAFLFPGAALAQDVTLIAREGGIVLSGILQGFDGEFYRIDTAYGPLTVDAQGVICDGPACPDLIAPKATLRFVGAPDAGAALIPPLFAAFARSRGLTYTLIAGPNYAAQITDPETSKVLADISFSPNRPDEAAAALTAGRAEFIIASRAEKPFGTRTIAMDALVPVMATDNPTPEVSTTNLARALSGEADNWAQIGGPDMPIVLHALAPDTDLQRALSDRLGAPIKADVIHPDLASLAAAVSKDPWALAITGRASRGAAKPLPLTDSCGFPLLATALAVKAEDYPLSLPLHLLTPPRRMSLFAREFLEFVGTPEAQGVIATAGYVDRSTTRQPMTADGLRLINAIQGAGEDVSLADLKRLVDQMEGADRLSLTFRFEDGAATLDANSRENLIDLARLIAAGQFRDLSLVLAGFSDGSGQADANFDLSLIRATGVLDALKLAAPDLAENLLPRVEAFGEALPMACDATAAGRQLNRRVELWVKPAFAAAPAPL